MDGYRQPAVVIALRGALDINARDALRRELSPAESAQEAVIDLSGVTYAGTTLLNALLRLRKRMRTRGGSGSIHLVGSSPQLRRVLTITNLDRVFDVA